jgi:UDP-sulfoquinovose synthase
MRVIVLGGDGYLGWPTAYYLKERGNDVVVVDNLVRRDYDAELGINSLVPINSPDERGRKIPFYFSSIHTNDGYKQLVHLIKSFKPTTIIHFAQQRTAPYSMIDREHCVYTHINNVIGNINVMYAIKATDINIHLVKLGTMGEYGTPETDIPEPIKGEALVEMDYKGKKDKFLFPKRGGSWYHMTKVHDSNNLDFANRVWGLKASDLNQGVVYGHYECDGLPTRFDYDQYFGTALNRFCVQAAINHPLSVYGQGGQTRGFINIKDTLRCIELVSENPPDGYEVYNQITEIFSVESLAKKVSAVTGAEIEHMHNPRVEKEKHYYNPEFYKLVDLGLEPNLLDDKLIKELYELALDNKKEIKEDTIAPTVDWRK